MNETGHDLVRELKALLREREEEALRTFLQLIRPEDLAGWLEELSADERQQILGALEFDAAGIVLDDTTASIRAELVNKLEPEQLARIAETLPSDEAADLIGELDTEEIEEVLHCLDDRDERVIRGLLSYPEDSAGGIMTPDVVALTADATVDDAITYLRSADEGTVTAALYVVDDERHLLGFVRLRRLVTARSTSKLGNIMSDDVISVDVNADQEEVADQVDKYNFISIPVIDSDNRLLGAVTFDDVLDIVEDEATEDIYKLAGSSAEEEESESILHIARFRLPWLLVCLAGTQLSTLVLTFAQGRVGLYEQMSVFTAAVMAMAGNTSLQSSTTTVRRLALDNLPRGRFVRHILREIAVALLMGVICGLVAAILAIVFGNDPIIGLALGIAMAMGMSAASMLGAAMPLGLDLVGIDPAVSSGPLVSTINDSLALTLFFAVATGILLIVG